ncbi:MAG: glycosyltransferase 87 family protein [Sumerlaeia bacterium]
MPAAPSEPMAGLKDLPAADWFQKAPLLWLACLPLIPRDLIVFSPSISIGLGLGWLAAVFAIVSVFYWRGWLAGMSAPVVLGTCFFLWLSVRTGFAGSYVSRLGLFGLLAFLLGASLHRRHLLFFLRAWIVALWFILALAALEWAGLLGQPVLDLWRFRTFTFGEAERLSASFFHPNLFAFYLLLSLVVMVWACYARRLSGRGCWHLWLQASFCGLFLSLTYSRGVILAAAVLAGGMLLLPRCRFRVPRRVLLSVAAAAALGMATGVWSAREVWVARVLQVGAMADQAMGATERVTVGEDVAVPLQTLSAEQLDVVGRVDIWRDALDFFAESPIFGHGVGEFFRWGQGFFHAHNVLLELIVSGGLVALMLLAGIIVFSRRLFPLRVWHIFLLTFLCAGIFDCFLFFRFPFLLFALALGVICRTEQGDTPSSWSVPRWRPLDGARTIQIRRHALWMGGLFLLLGVSRLTYQLYHHAYPIDSFTFYASVRYALTTHQLPYVAWPSGLRLPDYLPMTEWCLEEFNAVPFRFFYPPSAILVLAPLGFFPNPVAGTAGYYVFQFVMVLSIIYGASLLSETKGALWLAAIFVFAFAETQMDMLVGNVSLFMGALAVWAWICHARGYPLAAGALIAIATGVKVFPVIWLLYAVAKPRGSLRLFSGFAVTGGVLFGLSLAVFGWDFWVQYKFWVLDALSLYPPRGPNSSLLGLLWIVRGEEVPWLRAGLLASLALAIGTAAFRLRSDPDAPPRLALSVLAFSVLASPVAWSHYHVVPLGLLVSQIACNAPHPTRRLAYGFLLAFVCLSLGFFPSANWIATQFGASGLVLLTVLPLFQSLRKESSCNGKRPIGSKPAPLAASI